MMLGSTYSLQFHGDGNVFGEFFFLPSLGDGGEFSIGLKDYLAFILFTHVNVSMQGGVEDSTTETLAVFLQQTGPWLACCSQVRERLEVSVDMLKSIF